MKRSPTSFFKDCVAQYRNQPDAESQKRLEQVQLLQTQHETMKKCVLLLERIHNLEDNIASSPKESGLYLVDATWNTQAVSNHNISSHQKKLAEIVDKLSDLSLELKQFDDGCRNRESNQQPVEPMVSPEPLDPPTYYDSCKALAVKPDGNPDLTTPPTYRESSEVLVNDENILFHVSAPGGPSFK